MKRLALAASLVIAAVLPAQADDIEDTANVLMGVTIGESVCGFEKNHNGEKLMQMASKIRTTPKMKLALVEAGQTFLKLKEVAGQEIMCESVRSLYPGAFK